MDDLDEREPDADEEVEQLTLVQQVALALLVPEMRNAVNEAHIDAMIAASYEVAKRFLKYPIK